MAFKISFANPADRTASEQAVFGRQLENMEYLELAGNVFEFCALIVAFNEPWSKADRKGWNNGNSTIRIQAKSSVCTTVVRMVPGHFEFSSCNVYAQQKGVGTIVLWQIAKATRALGFQTIEASAERAEKDGKLTSFGHLVFPRLGFDADIPEATPARPAAVQGCIRLSQLLADPTGATFWDAEGVSIPEMMFDLTPGSLSWQTLSAKLIQVAQN